MEPVDVDAQEAQSQTKETVVNPPDPSAIVQVSYSYIVMNAKFICCYLKNDLLFALTIHNLIEFQDGQSSSFALHGTSFHKKAQTLPSKGGSRPEMENILFCWSEEQRESRGRSVPNKELQEMAQKFNNALGDANTADFKASRQWLRDFKNRFKSGISQTLAAPVFLPVKEEPKDEVPDPDEIDPTNFLNVQMMQQATDMVKQEPGVDAAQQHAQGMEIGIVEPVDVASLSGIEVSTIYLNVLA